MTKDPISMKLGEGNRLTSGVFVRGNNVLDSFYICLLLGLKLETAMEHHCLGYWTVIANPVACYATSGKT